MERINGTDMENTEYPDKIILALRAKYREKEAEYLPAEKEIMINGKTVALNREILFEGKCSILLPEIMVDMDCINRESRYRSLNRPPIIKTDYKSGATITFNLLPMSDIAVSEQMKEIRGGMMKTWKQNVFYDQGEILADGVPVVWMDFRAYCIDGHLYTLLFIFQVEDQTVLGNFHCSFSQYDIWKSVVKKILTTIRKGGIQNERISD